MVMAAPATAPRNPENPETAASQLGGTLCSSLDPSCAAAIPGRASMMAKAMRIRPAERRVLPISHRASSVQRSLVPARPKPWADPCEASPKISSSLFPFHCDSYPSIAGVADCVHRAGPASRWRRAGPGRHRSRRPWRTGRTGAASGPQGRRPHRPGRGASGRLRRPRPRRPDPRARGPRNGGRRPRRAGGGRPPKSLLHSSE